MEPPVAPRLTTDDPKWLRVPVAARRCDRTTRELYDLIDQGTLDAARDSKGMIVVPVAAVDALAG